MRALLALLFAIVFAGPLAAQQEGHDHALPFDEHHLDSHGDVSFDYLETFETHGRGEEEEHGHSGHTSLEGYPFLHGIRTEIDFVERALEFDLARTNNADDGLVDELEFEMELVWAINDRTIVIVGAPFIGLDPVMDPNASGVGDMELGVQFMAFNGERDLLFFALNMAVPTGDPDRDLGNGYAALEPTALWLHDFGCGNYMQSRVAWEVPVATPDVGSELKYDVGLYHSFMATRDWTMFRFLTPLIEANGTTLLHGQDYGETVVDMTIGLRWVVREMDEVGIGWSFPLTGRQNFDHQFIVGYRRHF